MTIPGQLAQSAHSAPSQSAPPFPGLLLPSNATNAGLLGNASAQVIAYSSTDVESVMETYHRLLRGAQPSYLHALLKRRRFTPEGQQSRIEKSLAALNAAQPTVLPVAQWKAVLEEIEDED